MKESFAPLLQSIPLSLLSAKELQVLALLANGKTNKEIAVTQFAEGQHYINACQSHLYRTTFYPSTTNALLLHQWWLLYKMFTILKKLSGLFVVQFFTWLGLFSLWIYATPVITRYVFHTTDAESSLFENGTTWVGICFAFYSLLAAALAFYLPVLLRFTSKQRLHACALFVGSIGLALLFFITQKYLLFVAFAFIGIGWSSISNIPYTIISDIAPEEKMTTYFSVFNFSVVIPQITAAFLLGYLNKHWFAGKTNYLMLAGGCSMFIASLCMFSLSANGLRTLKQEHD